MEESRLERRSLGDVREGLLLFLNMEWVRYLQFTKIKFERLWVAISVENDKIMSEKA